MVTKSLMISGLKRQNILLDELIEELENKNDLDLENCFFLEERTVRIANNLRTLRKIKDQYAIYFR